MAKNRSPFIRKCRPRSCGRIFLNGLVLLSLASGPAHAGQVIDDDSGSASSQAPSVEPQQYPREQSRGDRQTTKQIIANEIGRAIGQAVVQSITQGNQAAGSQVAPSRSPAYSSDPVPGYSPNGGRRPKGERF